MSEILEKHGLSLTISTATLINARKVLVDIAASMSAQTETTAKLQADIIKSSADKPANKKAAKLILDDFMSVLSDVFDGVDAVAADPENGIEAVKAVKARPELSAAMHDLIRSELLPYVRGEREYFALKYVRENRPKKADNTEEARKEYDEVKNLITTVHNYMLMRPTVPATDENGNLIIEDGKPVMVTLEPPSEEDFPTKLNSDGVRVANLPAPPKKGGGNTDGRSAKQRKVRWSVDGVDCPDNYIPEDVLKLIYQGSERKGKKVNDLFDAFALGVKASDGIYSGKKLERVINKHTVIGWTPVEELDESDLTETPETETPEENETDEA